MSHKFWTIKEELILYKLVNDNGYKWADHSKVLDGFTSEAIRKKFKRTDWEELFKSYSLTESQVAKESIEDLLNKATPPKTDEQILGDMLKSQKQKIALQAETRKLNEKIKEMAGQEMILEKLLGAVQELPSIEIEDIPRPSKDNNHTRPEDACLVLSDLHLGLAVKSDEVGGLSTYNSDVFIKRLWGLVDKIVRITDTHRKSVEVQNLNIFALGDNVHGSNDAGQWGFLHTEQNVVEQLFTLWLEMEKAILALSSHFENINFWGIYGNHGRVAKRNIEKPFVNWDYILYKILERGLSRQKNVKFNIPRSPFEIANVKGNKFLLMHGDQVRGWGGIPFYGMVRTEAKFRSLLTRLKSSENLWDAVKEAGLEKADPKDLLQFAYEYCKTFDYMIMGHFHQMAEIESSAGGRIIMNSSFFAGDDYSINNLQAASTPAQKFFGIHPEGKSWTYDIELDRE